MVEADLERAEERAELGEKYVRKKRCEQNLSVPNLCAFHSSA